VNGSHIIVLVFTRVLAKDAVPCNQAGAPLESSQVTSSRQDRSNRNNRKGNDPVEMGEITMKSFLPGTLLFALVAAAITVGAQAQSEVRSETTETAHVQPRGSGFAPRSAEDADIQRKLSRFNSEQQSLDRMFDKKLTICRHC
jgi:hypothetical protein